MTEEKKENLWLKMLRDYWSDPKNVIGPPGALVRRIFKCIWFGLAIYVLFFVAGPSQVASWRLWMHDDGLAWNIAWAFTIAGALCFAIVRYAAEGTTPVRVPLIIPKIEFEERKYKGWRIQSTHLHVPNLTVTIGGALVAGLFLISLLGMWNYYLHDNQSTGGSSVIATTGAASSVTEAEAAITAHDAAVALALATRQAAAAGCNTGYSPTGCSRLATAHAEEARGEREERARLVRELASARAANVTVSETRTDPRPVDGQVASATGLDRGLVASLLDLMRSGIVEALLVMGAALSLTGATSQIGVPREALSTETVDNDDEGEAVIPTPGAPQEPEAPPPPRFRHVLPVATAEDIAGAICVGPIPRPPENDAWEPPEGEEPEADDDDARDAGEPAPEPTEAADDDEIDPLAAELAREAAKEPA